MHELPHASATRRHRLPDARSRSGLRQLRPLSLPSGAGGTATANERSQPSRSQAAQKQNRRLTSFLITTEIRVKKGEPIERAIRRLKKKLEREQPLQQFRLRRRFEKPSARKRRKEKAARFAAMLKARHADD